MGLISLIWGVGMTWRLDQPIVENYVGRQIPTAMVARNLLEGRPGWFLDPQLDTGPFPNRLLVEPPGVAWAAACLASWLDPIDPSSRLEQAGRLVSIGGGLLALVGFALLSRPRLTPETGLAGWLAAVAALACAPVLIRYGRAFQNDAAALGLLLVGLALWDQPCRARRGCAVFIGSLAVALKALVAPVWLVGLAWIARQRRDGNTAWRVAATMSLIPMALWYGYVAKLLAEEPAGAGGSDAFSGWWSSVGPWAWLDPALAATLVRYATFRWMSPVGSALAWWGWGWWLARRRSFQVGNATRAGLDFFLAWVVVGGATLMLTGAKAHHEYYGLLLSPPLAAGVGWAVGRAGRGHSSGFQTAWRVGCLIALGCSGVVTAISTFHTPDSWGRLRVAGQELAAVVPPAAWVSAEEALLFAADRRGFRLEWTTAAIRRAVAEWSDVSRGMAVETPEELAEFHRRNGARFVAVLLGPGQESMERLRFAAWLRRNGNGVVRVDRAGVVLVVEWSTLAPPPISPRS